MSSIVFTNVSIFDGTGSDPVPGEVRVDGQRIAAVRPYGSEVSRDGATVIDGRGGTLMPGLIDAHAHLTFPFGVGRPASSFVPPVAEQTFATANNARLLLESGYTSAFSGGSLNAEVEVALKREIEAGLLPGPRLRACSFERSASGEPGQLLDHDAEAANAAAVGTWVDEMADLGCDNVKLILDGRSAVQPQYWELMNYGDDAAEAASRTAKARGMKMACHALTPAGVKQAVRNGFDAIYHATFADAEAIDMLDENKDRLILAPAIGILLADVYEGGFTDEQVEVRGSKKALEAMVETYAEIRRRGIPVLPGGDYGFPHNPHGTEARDLQHLVDVLGYTPKEVLSAATMHGGRLMGMGDELGLIREGYLADLLLVDGDPLADIKIMQDKSALRVIMQEGRFAKNLGPVAPPVAA
ncbi:amidohydrolase family protein [Streptomyces griseiscabiei]|uniref:Amidohydrolase family protein n=1 Tax=Streptomyces griseiscabiei TaxID=2993540 RepID=A0ABU4LHT2_9ACTN|nr:amidohydrolase family protein [Streptomyces griseiscabiei]MBZ3900405.1 amidohydrolase family protein [Streptomyces griseiscabiei]MDX2914573.1 amidohydrolase family protein [Streptomyces griseiscabiei]